MTVTRPLAIIEHDSTIAETLRRGVEAAGFRAVCFPDGAAALSSIHARSFSLAILDLHDDDEAFTVCREMSRLVPVITMTADDDEDVRVRAFEAGADDCVKPALAPRELVARVRNILRRTNDDQKETCELEELSISIPEMRVRRGGVTQELSRGETEVLSLLLDHAPAPLTAADLARLLNTKRATIESRVKSLRKKLGEGRLVSRGHFGYELR